MDYGRNIYMKNEKTHNKLENNKKTYKKPELKPLGDIRDVTMGGSPGIGDSTNSAIEKSF